MFVLGTAGHIDHGKSSLVRAMTGIDPDRLPEEKSRGLTIDLGFAWTQLPSGTEIGIIDVPGHERFVRNMAAGAGGINAAMLVIAADDGWMPQTQEHLAILQLLGLQHGFVALTKIDLVDKDWRDLVTIDIEEKLRGSFLENCPIIPVSATTGEHVDNVIAEIDAIATTLGDVDDIGKTRLFIDRSFILTGIGVVVTGTSRGGGFVTGSDAYHVPSNKKLRLRTVQAHGKQVDRVGPGSRVAVNVGGIDQENIRRGDVITSFPMPSPAYYIAAKITNLSDSIVPLTEGRHVLLILGTTETTGIIRPFPDKGILPGQSDFAIIKVEQPLAAFVGDRFILRLPTPPVTVGGGLIVDILDLYPRRKLLPHLRDHLDHRDTTSIESLVLTELNKAIMTERRDLLKLCNFSDHDIQQTIDNLISSKTLIAGGDRVGVTERVQPIIEAIIKELEKTHRNKSYLPGLTAETITSRVKMGQAPSFIYLLEYMTAQGNIERTRQYYHLPGFSPHLGENMKHEAEQIQHMLQSAGHAYPEYAEIKSKFPDGERTIRFLRDQGRLISISDTYIILADLWEDVMAFVRSKLNKDNMLALAEFRDRFQTSRKYALPVLEHLDQLGITRREGDIRVKGPHFDDTAAS